MSAMRVVIVGAGAVGAVIGTLLANAGHEVHFWLDTRARPLRRALSVQRRGAARVSASPRWLCAGDAIPAGFGSGADPRASADWVIVCVRGEQLDAALQDVRAHMGTQARVAIAAVSLSRVIEQARANGLTGEVYALHTSFGCYRDEGDRGLFHWTPFLPPSTVTPDGVRACMSQARGLARGLAKAGIPAIARLSMSWAMRLLAALISVLALGWDLCGWQPATLARHAELRRETAGAMHEALALLLPARSPLRLLPRAGFTLFLRVFPWLMSARGRELWLRHGPKIRAQTEYVTRQLLTIAEQQERGVPTLRALFARWRTASASRSP